MHVSHNGPKTKTNTCCTLTPFLEGKVLLLDKPIGWTSFNMVQKVRYLTKVAKVGHAGTLRSFSNRLINYLHREIYQANQ